MTRRARTFRLMAAATLGISAMLLTACATSDSESTGEEAAGLTLAEVQEAGTLVVGTEGTYSPFSFREGGDGELTGYDVEIITAVAKELDVEVTFEETQWDALFAALDSGRIDLIANQVSITPERLDRYLFSAPYSFSPGVLVVPEDSDIQGLDDLSGRTSAQSITSNWAEVAREAGATIEEVEGFAQAADLLRSGRVDATINDRLTVLDYQQTQGEAGIRIAGETSELSESALAFRAGSEDLVTAVDAALESLQADGTLASISERYFGENVSER